MDSVIEVQRQTHEEIERFEQAIASLLSQPPTTRKEQLKNEHRASDILDRITARATTLHSLYVDQDNTRHTETISLSSADLSEFYTRLAKIKDYYNKYPEQGPEGFELELAGVLGEEEDLYDAEEYEDPVALLFSGEESYGRYVDLYANHTQYNNLKNIPKHVSYIQYLDILASIKEGGMVHPEVSSTVRLSKEYENYITSLYNYLLSYTKRTQPLVDIESQQRDAMAEFEKLWNEGQITGWGDDYLGPNGSEGVYCTACQKLYAKQTVYDAHLKSKKHIKAAARESNPASDSANKTTAGSTPSHSTSQPSSSRPSKYFKAALYTNVLAPLLVPLIPTLTETKSNLERRFALTARERETEAEGAEQQQQQAQAAAQTNGTTGAAEEEEEEERIYNPLKLPLGWDGKPIPYWLYKLHGLGVEYRCEICSDGVYMGRKNFERHFQESRHAFGMRALGLPNTKHFHEITRIEDALALAEKLKQEGRQEIFQNETMEEMEDDDGNVYNKKTYEDLKKQGII
ncbi:hypothetical protein FRC02_010478 [Tulasnella sp. 418]|nr:hypothetical protein FRC02_010478 [Tulasnella sp. 418]